MKLLAGLSLSLLLLTAGIQKTAANELPAGLRAHINGERFAVVTSIRGLPLGVRDELQTLFEGTLDIADPGAPITSGSTAARPARRLIAAGCARDNHCFIYYELVGPPPGWRVVLFHWTPEVTRFEWGAVAPGGLKIVDEVRTAVLSGGLKAATTW